MTQHASFPLGSDANVFIFFPPSLLSEATHGQASVCAECRCTADLQSLSSGPHSAVTAQITLVQMPERISFWLAVPVYRCLHGSAPGYLASDLQRMSHVNARR